MVKCIKCGLEKPETFFKKDINCHYKDCPKVIKIGDTCEIKLNNEKIIDKVIEIEVCKREEQLNKIYSILLTWDYTTEPTVKNILNRSNMTSSKLWNKGVKVSEVARIMEVEYYQTKMGNTLYDWDINIPPKYKTIVKMTNIPICILSRLFKEEITELREYYKDYHQIRLDHENKLSIAKSLKKYTRGYQKRRRKADPLFNLTCNIRSITYQALKNKGFSKTSKTADILGCTFEEFKVHTEALMEPWMSWENKGKYNGTLNYGWDIDHIIPLSSATTEEEILKLSHYTNLQPLCSYINRDIKRDNYDNNWADNIITIEKVNNISKLNIKEY